MSLFLFLSACSPSLSTSLETEEKELSAQTEFVGEDTITDFSSGLYETESDGVYHYQYILDNAASTHEEVRVILSPEEGTYFFFGYDGTYTLVSSDEEKDVSAKKYAGIEIYFSSSASIASLSASFRSKDLTLFYTVTPSTTTNA